MKKSKPKCRHKSDWLWERFNASKDQYEWYCEKCCKTVKVVTRFEMVHGKMTSPNSD